MQFSGAQGTHDPQHRNKVTHLDQVLDPTNPYKKCAVPCFKGVQKWIPEQAHISTEFAVSYNIWGRSDISEIDIILGGLCEDKFYNKIQRNEETEDAQK